MKHKAIKGDRLNRLIKMHGDVCIACGADRDIEWHHVFPLHLGGPDTDENIVPVCRDCHLCIHSGIPMKGYKPPKSRKKKGRKTKMPKNYKDIFDDFIFCRIDKDTLKERLGLSNKNAVTDSQLFMERLKELGITSYRNNILVKRKNGVLYDGCVVGYAKLNGKIKFPLYYNRPEQNTATQMLMYDLKLDFDMIEQHERIVGEMSA